MRHAIKNVHFVGVGGSGMSGIAEVLANEGYQVSGSDIAHSPTTRRLAELGVRICVPHSAANIEGVDCLVISTAIPKENEELFAARQKGIPLVSRAVMLAELMRMKKGIAVAGTHGKTTTTSLVASILAKANLDPTYVIGGKLNSLGANAKLGKGEYIVVEADESDASFLNLSPIISIVTNIDQDHMETYDHSNEKLKAAFLDFLHRLPFYGSAVLCQDDSGVQSIMNAIERPIITYGIKTEADVIATNIRPVGRKMQFTVDRGKGFKGSQKLDITLNLVGKHNVLNALSAIAVASELEIPDDAIISALEEFKGVSRRFQHYGFITYQDKKFDLIDDYGHHPIEVEATLDAARGAYPNKRLVLAFQPHRYSRTRDCFEDFVRVLSKSDSLIIAEVYAAGESPIVASDGRSLCRALRVANKIEPIFVENVSDMASVILDQIQDGDIVLCMGAGSIGGIAAQLINIVQGSKE